MTYAEYLRGLLESFPGYVEKSQPNEPPYLCMVADACIVRLYRDYPKEFSSIERCHERFLKRMFVVIPICIVVVVWLLSRW